MQRSPRVAAYREERARARNRQSLNEALLAFFQGRYASAEKSAANALGGEETKGVAAIIAARSAHELGRFTEREQFLDQAKGVNTPELDQARLTTLADLLVSRAWHEEALAGADLSARDARNRLLRLHAGRAGDAGRDEELRPWSPAEAGHHPPGGQRPATHLGNLNRKARRRGARGLLETDPRRRPPRSTPLPPRRAITSPGGNAEAQDHRAALEREWNRAWSRSTESGDRALPQIERAEKWLRAHARDPALLLALGELCMRQALWGKAQSYIEASLALEPTHDGHMTLAALMERLGKPQEAVRHFRRSAELAG
jgi:HemY protein